MPGIPVARVVAVVADMESGKTEVGSGYLLDEMCVLTAWHCTVDSKTGQAAARLRVVRAADGAAAAVAVGEAAAGLDVALLTVIGDPPWGAELPGGQVEFGSLDREHAGQLDGCEAVGFPRWQESGNGGFRDVAEVHGLIRALEGVESQRLVLRDPVLGGVVADGGPTWAGFSGAAVFHGGLLLGVVIEHHARQGDTALQIRPVEAIAKADDSAARRLAEALGIGRDGALRPVATCSWIVNASPGPHLWLRSGPGFDYPTIGWLSDGQRADGNSTGVESGGTIWYYLRRNDHGWAWGNSAYLEPI